MTGYICSRCNEALKSAEDLQSHEDWHFAKDLHDQDRGRAVVPVRSLTPSTSSSKKAATNPNKKKNAKGKPEKGQSKLAFG